MPGLDVLLAQGTHAVVEFALVTCMSTGNSATRTKTAPMRPTTHRASVSLDLTRIASHNDRIKVLAHLEEGVVLLSSRVCMGVVAVT